MCTRRVTHLFFLDDGVISGENIVFVFGSHDLCLSVSLSFSPSFVNMSSSNPTGVARVNRWTKNSAERLENFYCESLAFSRHNIELVFDEEIVKPERLTEAPENAGTDPDTMKVSKWNQDATREDVVPHFSSSSRMSDAFTGMTRTSYQVREPIEDDDERLAMKRREMPSPVPRRVPNPRIRDDRASHEFSSNSDKMHRATPDDARSVFPQSVRKQAQTLSFQTYQRTSAAFS